MKKSLALLTIILCIMSIVFLAYAGHDPVVIPYEAQALGKRTTMPLPGAGDLRHHIIGHMPYKNWKLWPDKEKMFKGTEPHGALLTVYVNDIALKSLKKMKGMDNNSIVLKENYTADKQLDAITVMYKVKGYNPEGGDWFWAKYNANFEILKEGKVKGCLDCHGNAKDNDYIFTGKVAE